MNLSSHWYKAAGASIVAGALAARYVAKWRRNRSLRFNDQESRAPSGGRYFIGLDLTNPTAKTRRPCDVAVLTPELDCIFSLWDYHEEGSGIVPPVALGRSFLLAVDGPQGLAAGEDATMRESERAVNVPGRTPYEFPPAGKPYAGFITGSVKLFYHLVKSGSRFRLLGLEDVPAHEANLMEVFPAAGWKLFAGRGRLPRKNTVEGREARYAALKRCGVGFPAGPLPTDDQLDAAMAAWIGYRFSHGQAVIEGVAPWVDTEHSVIREGYIVQALPTSEGTMSDEPEAPIAPV